MLNILIIYTSIYLLIQISHFEVEEKLGLFEIAMQCSAVLENIIFCGW